MKRIILGICDYFKDCRHDRLMKKAEKLNCKLYEPASRLFKKNIVGYVVSSEWKEGPMIYYILQRFMKRKKF